MMWFHMLARVQGVTALVVVLCIMMAAIMLFNDQLTLAGCFLTWSVVGCGAICWEDILLAQHEDEQMRKREETSPTKITNNWSLQPVIEIA